MTFRKIKGLFYNIITLLLGIFVADLLFGFSVSVLNLYPKISDFSAGAQSYHLQPHPFRSYKAAKSEKQLWVHQKDIINNKEYDYSLLQNGTITNHYGHQVLEADNRLDIVPKQDKEMRIFFTGGSTTYQPWPNLVQMELQALYPSIDTKIINAGAGGYTSLENMIDVTTTASAYDPDIVVAYLPINDIYWVTAYEDDWIAHDYSHMRTEFRWKNLETKPKPERLLDISYPFLAAFISDWIEAKRLDEYFAERKLSHSVYVDGWSFDPSRATKAKVDVMVQIIARNIFLMHSFCKFQGCKFIFLTQKMFGYKGFADSEYTPLTEQVIERIMTQIPEEITVLKLDEIFPDKWTKDDIKLVELWYAERGKQPAKDFTTQFSYDDMHFSPEALVLLAKKLTPEIAKYGRLYQ